MTPRRPAHPEVRFLDLDPVDLSLPPADRPTAGDDGDDSSAYRGPRMAKTPDQVRAVQNAWEEELYSSDGRDDDGTTETRAELSSVGAPHIYTGDVGFDDGAEVTFHGYVVRPPPIASSKPGEGEKKLPCVVMFQTGAGPRDLYFHWKADQLCRGGHPLLGTGRQCVTFVADLLSDERGWGWDNEKTYYNGERRKLLEIDGETGAREKLRARTRCAVDAAKALKGVDGNNIAVLGWCLGGNVVVEVGRMNIPGVRCMASYHGVVEGCVDILALQKIGSDGEEKKPVESVENVKLGSTERGPGRRTVRALLCHGGADPYVAAEDLAAAQTLLMDAGVEWTLLEFAGVVHGFSNPAMGHNPNKNFCYNAHAAQTSWDATIRMIGDCCFRD